MKPLESTGRTVEEAIEKALVQLGVDREDVEVHVVDKGGRGLLGLGGGEARIQVELLAGDVFDIAKEVLETMLRNMGVSATVALPETSQDAAAEGGIPFDIEGDDAGLLIGRRGETLSALQFLVNLIVSRRVQNKVSTNIDIEGYKERRNEQLRGEAKRMADRATQTGRTVTLDPMHPRERRIIHLALSDSRKVTTESIGEGDDRRITIIPKRESGGRRPPQ
jgi:spoIIIJ-associated protein